MDDAQVERARAGDVQALDHLMTTVYTLAYRSALQFWNDVDRAEDTAQDVCVRVLRALPRYRPQGQFRAWILQITFNVLRHQWRYERVRRWFHRISPNAFGGRSPEDQAMDQNEFQWLIRGLQHLSVNERMALILRAFHDLHYGEIAQVMGCSLQQVKNYIFRARQKLRRRWAQEVGYGKDVPSVSDAMDGSPG